MFCDLTKAQQHKASDGIYRALRLLKAKLGFSDADLEQAITLAMNRLSPLENERETAGLNRTTIAVGIKVFGDENLLLLKEHLDDTTQSAKNLKQALDDLG